MQHQAWILYNGNVTQSDSEMYYLHESSCHFQFMRQFSIQSTGLAGVEGWLFESPQERPVLFLINVLNTALQT